MPISKKQQNKVIGDLGELIVEKYLINKGFQIIERNYWRKWGEIDIVAEKDSLIHFVEVKTVSYETKNQLCHAVSHETWRPEEQVHSFKLGQIHKALETWLVDNHCSNEWQIDVAAVRVVPRETYATVRFIDNVII